MTKYRNKIDSRITEPGDQIILWDSWRQRATLGPPAEYRVTAVKADARGYAERITYVARTADEGWETLEVATTEIHEVARYADATLTWDGVALAELAEGQTVLVDWSGTWRRGQVLHLHGIQVVATFPRNSTGDRDTRPMPRNRIMTQAWGTTEWPADPSVRYGYPAPAGQTVQPYVRTATAPPAPEVLECIPGCKPPAAGQRNGSHEIGCPVFGAILAAGDGEAPVVDYRTGLGRAFRPGLDAMADQADPSTRRPAPAPVVTVRLINGHTYDLARLNAAMDVFMACGTLGSTRTALVYTHGWEATEAVQYAGGADFCISNVLDPAERESWWVEEVHGAAARRPELDEVDRITEPIGVVVGDLAADQYDAAAAAYDADERDAVLADVEREGAEELAAERGSADIPVQRDALGATGAEVLAEIQAADEAPEIPGQRAAGADEEFPELAPGRDPRAVGWALHSPGLVALGRDAIGDKRSHLVRSDILAGARLADDVRARDLVVVRRHPGLWRYMADGADGMVMIIRAWAPGEAPEGDGVWLHRSDLVPAPVVRMAWRQLQGGEFLAERRGELDRVADEGMWAPELAALAGAERVRVTVDTAVAAGERIRNLRAETPDGVVRVYLDAEEWWASLVAEDSERPAVIARRGRWLLVWPEAGDLAEFLECETAEAARVDYANWHADPRITPRVGDAVSVFGAGPRGDGLHLEIREVVDEIGTEDLDPGETAWDVTGPRLGLGYGAPVKVRLRRGMFAWTTRA